MPPVTTLESARPGPFDSPRGRAFRRSPARSRRRPWRRGATATAVYAVLALIGVCFLVPFAWLLLASVDPDASLRTELPAAVTLEHYRAVLETRETTILPVANGLVLSAGASLVTVLAALLAAYPLSRYPLRYRRPFLYTVLFATGLPVTAIMVPVYGLFVRLRLLDSVPATMLFLAATALPSAIWLMKGFIDGVPVELEEAAWTDGGSWPATLFRIVLPLTLPGVSVVGMFTFLLTWGNFFVPFILLQSPDKLPASVAIYQFFTSTGTVAYGQLAAYSVIYSTPVVVLYLVISRVLGGAFRLAGAVKG